MNSAGQNIVVGGICRPYGAWQMGGVLATKMSLLAELGGGKINTKVFKCFSILLLFFLAQLSYSQDVKTNVQTNIPTIKQSFVSEKTNQPIVVQLEDVSEKSLISEILNTPSVSALIGLLAALGGFFLADFLNNRKTHREEKQKYKAALWSARHELLFYSKQFKELAEQMELVVPLVEKLRTGGARPSFAVYSEFLAEQKKEICAFSKNHELVLKVVECHFDLCHIKEKLIFLSEFHLEPDQQEHFAFNLKGLGSLAKASAPLFEETAITLAAEAESI